MVLSMHSDAIALWQSGLPGSKSLPALQLEPAGLTMLGNGGPTASALAETNA
jgi:hypothetical protein